MRSSVIAILPSGPPAPGSFPDGAAASGVGGVGANRGCCAIHIGRVIVKVEPRPSSLSSWIVPPCISTRRRAIESPSPVPARRERTSPVCRYSSKTADVSSGGMPGPVSWTTIAA